jgi:hypothetical protein
LLTDDDAMLIAAGRTDVETCCSTCWLTSRTGAGRDLEPAIRRLRRGVDEVLTSLSLGTVATRPMMPAGGPAALRLDPGCAAYAEHRDLGGPTGERRHGLQPAPLLSNGWRVLRAELTTPAWLRCGPAPAASGSAPATGWHAGHRTGRRPAVGTGRSSATSRCRSVNIRSRLSVASCVASAARRFGPRAGLRRRDLDARMLGAVWSSLSPQPY